MARHPPVWVPPPPEPPECQAAAKCTVANAPLSETSKVWGCGNNSEGELGLGIYYVCVCLRVCVFTCVCVYTHINTLAQTHRYRHEDTDREGKPAREPGVL